MRNIIAPVVLSTYTHDDIEYVAVSRASIVGSTCLGCCFRVDASWGMEYCEKPLSFSHPYSCINGGVIYIEKQP